MNRMLVIAPHNDDEVLGAGGTILKYVKVGWEVSVCEVTSGNRIELIKQEAYEAHRIMGVSKSIFLEFPAVKLNEVAKAELNATLCKTIEEVKPSVVLIPHYGDMHLDHRIVTEASMVALRPPAAPFVKAIYAYETLSETEWNIPSVSNAFIPNMWVDISEEISLKQKAMAAYKSQVNDFPHPRSLEAIEKLAGYRGSTVGVNEAEAFMVYRQLL